jgi:tetratricopeptide (TPR) repeat protein
MTSKYENLKKIAQKDIKSGIVTLCCVLWITTMETNDKLQLLLKFDREIEGKNHFDVLGVTEETGEAELRSAYFDLLKKFGADYFHQVSDAGAKAAIDRVNKAIRQAYDTLSKPEKRAEYVAQLHGEAAPQAIDIADVFEAEQSMSQARSLMERGDFAVALPKLERAIQLDPKSVEGAVRLAYTKYMLLDVGPDNKRNQESVEACRKTLTETLDQLPKADYLRVYLGDIENLEGNNTRAIDWYKKAIRINPENLQATRGIKLIEGRAQRAKQETEKPKSFFEKLKAVLTKKM